MLTPFAIVLVLSAAFLHASWNALLRGGADRTQSMLIMNVTVGIAGLAMMAIGGLPAWASAAYVIASGLIHLVYNALLVRMYRSGDLGETYPGRARLFAGVGRARRQPVRRRVDEPA